MKTIQKFLMMIVAILTFSVATASEANAQSYTGTVSNITMNGDVTTDKTATFTLSDGKISGNFSLDKVFPPHKIYFEMNEDGTSARCKVTVFGIGSWFDVTVSDLVLIADGKLSFKVTGNTPKGSPITFDFASN